MYFLRIVVFERFDFLKFNNNNNKDFGFRFITYGGCEERGRNRVRERLFFLLKEDEENEKNFVIIR